MINKNIKYNKFIARLLKTPIKRVIPLLLWSMTLNLVLVLVLVAILIFNILHTAAVKDKTITKLNSNIKITAAHLGDLEGYKLIHEDSDRDVSYYIANDLKLTEVPIQEVKIEGLSDCRIISSEPGEFLVETSTPDKIVNGMSGKIVYDNNNNAIGFVDALVKDRRIKCLTLE